MWNLSINRHRYIDKNKKKLNQSLCVCVCVCGASVVVVDSFHSWGEASLAFHILLPHDDIDATRKVNHLDVISFSTDSGWCMIVFDFFFFFFKFSLSLSLFPFNFSWWWCVASHRIPTWRSLAIFESGASSWKTKRHTGARWLHLATLALQWRRFRLLFRFVGKRRSYVASSVSFRHRASRRSDPRMNLRFLPATQSCCTRVLGVVLIPSSAAPHFEFLTHQFRQSSPLPLLLLLLLLLVVVVVFFFGFVFRLSSWWCRRCCWRCWSVSEAHPQPHRRTASLWSSRLVRELGTPTAADGTTMMKSQKKVVSMVVLVWFFFRHQSDAALTMMRKMMMTMMRGVVWFFDVVPPLLLHHLACCCVQAAAEQLLRMTNRMNRAEAMEKMMMKKKKPFAAVLPWAVMM